MILVIVQCLRRTILKWVGDIQKTDIFIVKKNMFMTNVNSKRPKQQRLDLNIKKT